VKTIAEHPMDQIPVRPLEFDFDKIEKRDYVWSQTCPKFSVFINALASIMTKKIVTAVALAATTMVTSNAFAQAKEAPWMVRVRAANIQSANTDSTGLGLSVNNKTIPEVDFSYFFGKNLAAELLLTVPQEHNLFASGAKIGTVTHLAPTLLLQYHFDASGFKPYFGVGLNYTKFTSVSLPAGVDVDRSSVGGALQFGVDIALSGNMYLNFDVKKIYIGTDVSLGGVKAGSFKLDPLLVGLGLGWRF
jgi:outer membrane protein